MLLGFCEPALREVLDEFIESRRAQNTRDAYRIALDGFIRSLKVVTLDEFLGTTAQFNKLDTNSDDFIELKEVNVESR